jgi:transcriptional regulator with XRE-family HTH domain
VDAGRLVRRARHEAELTQQAMASRAGVSRQTVAHIELGARLPSVTTLVRLLAAAGKQMQIELVPLDDDVRRAIAELRAGKGSTASEVVDLIGDLTMYGSQRSILEIPHRFEGLAAAQLLGAPVPVKDVELALPDVPTTWSWMVRSLERVWSIAPPGWSSPLSIAGLSFPPDEAAMHVREQVREAAPDGTFRLRGPLAEVGVRLVEPGHVERRVLVKTEHGTVAVQPLDEIQALDGWSARVLAILREEPREECG